MKIGDIQHSGAGEHDEDKGKRKRIEEKTVCPGCELELGNQAMRHHMYSTGVNEV